MSEGAFRALEEALTLGARAVLVAIVDVAGSTPRERGAMLVVASDGRVTGTIGGGSAEHAAIATARSLLAAPDPKPRIETFRLNPVLDQCCGGRMDIAIAPFAVPDLERLRAARRRLDLWDGGPAVPLPLPPRPVIVYGGGHVGTALVSALAPLPFAVRWIDARKDGFGGPAPAGVETVLTPLPEPEARAGPAGAFHLVMTHSHALDLEIVAAVLEANVFGFLGLIGSATKRALFDRRLAERGVAPAERARLVCPIGIPGIIGKAPSVIAAATAAQILTEDARLACEEDHDALAGAGS